MTTDATPADLTPREREVMELLAGGADYADVRDRLGITYSTVQQHVRNVKRKTRLTGPVHRVVAWYVEARHATPGLPQSS